jgi:hypothetical protein
MSTHSKLKCALKAKATRYGAMQEPFVIAISARDPVDELDLCNAFFGDEVFSVPCGTHGAVGQVTWSRRPNGFWYGPSGPQNTRVSAVLVVSELFPWSIAAQRPVLYHNPWAKHPLDRNLIPTTQLVFDASLGAYEEKVGLHAHEIFGLPSVWPIGSPIAPMPQE